MTLTALAEMVRAAWQALHSGGPVGAATPLLGADRFAVQIEAALHRPQLVLARQPDFRGTVEGYIEQLLSQLGADTRLAVEAGLRRRVVTADACINFDSGWILILYRLGEPLPRAGSSSLEGVS